MTFAINMELGASPDSVSLIRHIVEDAAQSLGIDKALTDDLKTAVSEAATNAVLHPYGPDGGPMTFSMEVQDQSVEMLVTDKGGGIGSEPISATHGLGLGLMVISAVADRAEFTRTPEGTEVRMSFRVSTQDDRWRGGGATGQVAGGAASPPRRQQAPKDGRASARPQRHKAGRHGLDRRTVDQARGYISRLRQHGR